MFILALFLCSLFIWLLYETKWLTMRLPTGQLPLAITAGVKEAIIYLLAITAAEAVTVFVQPVWGIVCHAIVLVAVIVHSALASDSRYRHLVLSLALVPLVRIISLSMPLVDIPQIWWYPILYVPLLAAAIVVMRILGQKAREVGLNFGSLPVQLAVGLSGLLFGVAEYFILVRLPPEPLIKPLIAELT